MQSLCMYVSGGNVHHLSHLLAAPAAHAQCGSPSFPISQCRRTSRGRELMGRLLILIFPKVRNALSLAHFTASQPACIRRDARVRADCLRFDLTQTETLVPEKRISLFFFFALSPSLSLSLSRSLSLSLSLPANATGSHS